MKGKAVSGITLTLLMIGMLVLASVEIREVFADPTVRIYAEMPPQGYIPGVPVGEILKVSINIESPLEWKNTENGIIGWGFYVHVDPDVLEPLTVIGAKSGYFLDDFASEHGYFTVILFATDREAGLFRDVAEFIMGWGSLGVGAGGDGKLCELWFKSKSQTAYTLIDLYDAKYTTSTGLTFPVEIIGDGCYNTQKLPVAVDIDPDTLNLKSQGKWITAYIQLPEGLNPNDIDATTILLNETIQPVLDPMYDFVTNPSEYLVDHNEDGVLERMVKFDRAMVQSFIYNQGIRYDNVPLTITGELLDGTPFEGTDVIFVNYAGDANNDGIVNILDAGMVSAHWYPGPPIGPLGYDETPDFNSDGAVDILDAGILSVNWGQTTPTP